MMRERAVVFDCAGEALVGVIAQPDAPRATGVVLVVGGPQVRAGSHRHYVLLARRLARAGHAVLRFDVRGMGDSGGAPRDFLSLDDDIAAAISALLQHMPAVSDVVLWGLCDAASAALLYTSRSRDARVRGLCLVNPWVRSPATQARTRVRHYYAQRLVQREFWAKLLRGQVSPGALTELARDVRSAGGPDLPAASYQTRMAAAWHAFAGPLLLLLSEHDLTAREFADHAGRDPAWRGALERPRLTRCDIAQADHTFSGAAAREAVEAQTQRWLQETVA
jgi:exosortase A-associated hydrolase 1